MTSQDEYLKEFVSAPPLIAFKKQKKTLQEHLIRASIPNFNKFKYLKFSNTST